jgi:hypothetical protein
MTADGAWHPTNMGNYAHVGYVRLVRVVNLAGRAGY